MADQRVSCGRDFFCVPDLAGALRNATNGGYGVYKFTSSARIVSLKIIYRDLLQPVVFRFDMEVELSHVQDFHTGIIPKESY